MAATRLSTNLPIIIFVFFVLILSPDLALSARERRAEPQYKENFVPGQVLVKFKEEVSTVDAQALLAAQGAESSAQIEPLGVKLLAVAAGQEQAVVEALRENAAVEYAELDYLAYIGIDPNDPYYATAYQWGLTRIEAPAAWDITTGTQDVIIAVIDTGVDLDHPDLEAKIVGGYDFINNDPVPQDDHGHGTRVAGIAAAETNNGLGVAGLSWGARIMPLKALEHTGYGPYSNIASSVTYAADSGARVLNLSLGGLAYSATLRDAINYAYNRGCVVVASTGNDSLDSLRYPARYPSALAVGATDNTDQQYSTSNYGPEIDLAAPGAAIYSTFWDDSYGSESGTSMAAPHVSGLAALIWSLNPALSNVQVESIIKATAQDLGAAGRDVYYGFGRINARAALEATAPSLTSDQTALTFVARPESAVFSGTVTIGNGAMYGSLEWSVVESPPVEWLSMASSPGGSASSASPAELRLAIDARALTTNTYTTTALVINSTTPYVPNSPITMPVSLSYPASADEDYLPLTTRNGVSGSYHWIDATQRGTVLPLAVDPLLDEDVWLLSLPFGVRFYGLTYNSLWVSANGFVSFEDSASYPSYYRYTNSCIPDSYAPNNALYALWDHLQPADGGGHGTVYVKQVDNDTLVIEWYQVKLEESAATETFEIVLRRDSNVIKVQYQDVSETSSATVGTENSDGMGGQQFYCKGEGDPVYNGLAIEFTTP